MTPLPSPSSAAEREKMVAAMAEGIGRLTDGEEASSNDFTLARRLVAAERLIPPVSPDAEEEVVGWAVVDRAGMVNASGGPAIYDALVKKAERWSTIPGDRRAPYRVCKVVAVAPTPDPAPSGRVYRWEGGKLFWRHVDAIRPEWVQVGIIPVSDIPHVAKLMGVSDAS